MKESALNVMKGVGSVKSLNPNLGEHFQKTKRRNLTLSDYVEGIRSGDRLVLSKAITLVESNREEHHELAQQIIESILPYTGDSIRIGITGVPGVGKSTFIECFGEHLITQGNKLAVLAIDPTSQRTHGSILGDLKIKMLTFALPLLVVLLEELPERLARLSFFAKQLDTILSSLKL
jgi:LAO/AO transport system kinase